jgi:hypothetical protein
MVDALETADSLPGDRLRRQGTLRLIHGFVWCFIGATLTASSYLAAQRGSGFYVIAYGAIIFGIVQMARAWPYAFGRRERQARELVDFAARLESADRTKAIEIYRKVILLFPGSSACIEAQRKVEVLLSPQE